MPGIIANLVPKQIEHLIELSSQDGQVIIVSARRVYGWGVTPGVGSRFRKILVVTYIARTPLL